MELEGVVWKAGFDVGFFQSWPAHLQVYYIIDPLLFNQGIIDGALKARSYMLADAGECKKVSAEEATRRWEAAEDLADAAKFEYLARRDAEAASRREHPSNHRKDEDDDLDDLFPVGDAR